MYYSISPQEFISQQKGRAAAYERQQRQQLEQSINDIKENYDDKKRSVKFYDKGYGIYFKGTMEIVEKAWFIIALIGCAIAGALYGYEFAPLLGQTGTMQYVVLLVAAVAGAIIGYIFRSVIKFFGRYIYGAPVALILTPIAYPIFRSVMDKRNQESNDMLTNLETNKQNEITELQKQIYGEIDQYRRQIESEIQEYQEGFDLEAERRSEDFAHSELAGEIIAWLVEEFTKDINEANRAAHIERINVAFNFKVAENEIVSPYSTYSFEEHRCENLPNLVSQSGLAIAIAKNMISAVEREYHMDASGKPYTIEATHRYDSTKMAGNDGTIKRNFVCAELIYSAENGNYQPIKKW